VPTDEGSETPADPRKPKETIRRAPNENRKFETKAGPGGCLI
jgi:hypothetical protein